MTEVIGNVVLDLSKYSGQDYYSEGASEDLLLELVKNNTPDSFNRVIAENAGWSTLYHLSDIRGNIVDFLPVTKEHKVLEVGAGCGAITGTIAAKAGSVTSIELSKKRSMINAYRNRECDNLDIKVGNFQDIEVDLPNDYDFIMLIGVFEYAASYIKDKKPYEKFLEILKNHLKEGGRLVIAIENKYGLKYWAGAREDHLGSFYSGIEGYHTEVNESSPVCTFSKERLIKLSKAAGFKVSEYYPYPDYKLPITIYSSERMPQKGELSGRGLNFDYDRVVAFDEGTAFDDLIDEGLFSQFSNSFLFMLQKGERLDCFSQRTAVYSKHSNERSRKYAIRTDIEKDGNGVIYVTKHPIYPEGMEHVKKMGESYERLLKQYESSVFTPNKYIEAEDGAEFEYVVAGSLEEKLLTLLSEEDKDGFYELFDKYRDEIRKLPDVGIVNFDLIPSNILMTGDEWTVIDYEWVREEGMDQGFVLYRGIRYLLEGADAVGLLEQASALKLYARCGITDAMISEYNDKELSLQRDIAGERLSLIGFYSIFGQDAYKLDDLLKRATILKRIDKIKVYYDMGSGFSEENTCYYTSENQSGDTVSFDIPVLPGTVSMRVDPSDDPCIVKILEADAKEMLVNGVALSDAVVYYASPDPQIIFTKVSGEKVHIKYEITAFNRAMYSSVGEALVELHAQKKTLKEFFRKKGPYERLKF